LKPYIDLIVPAINFVLLAAVGMDLTPADFARVRRQRSLLIAGLVAPLLVLPPIALGLVALFHASREVAGGVLLIAACPIGGISNAYSYLARASTALSVTLTALSCLLATVTIPLVGRGLERATGRPLDFAPPILLLFGQLLLVLALPVIVGMWIRRRWPDAAARHRPMLQRLAFCAIAVVLMLVIVDDPDSFAGGLSVTVPLAIAFVSLSIAAGWLTAALFTSDPRDRFTVAAEFGTRNIVVALAIAVTLLGRVEFARFATTYALVEIPMMLSAAAIFRRRQSTRHARRSSSLISRQS
jgi:bile acid:Na+ symporter, BASS family